MGLFSIPVKRQNKSSETDGLGASIYIVIQFYLSCPLRRQTSRKSFCFCSSLTALLTANVVKFVLGDTIKLLQLTSYLSNLTAADSEPNVCGSSVPIAYIGFASLRFVTKGFSETTRRDLSQSTERLPFEKSRDSKHILNSAFSCRSVLFGPWGFCPCVTLPTCNRRAPRTSDLRPPPRPCFTESRFAVLYGKSFQTDPSPTCCRSTFLSALISAEIQKPYHALNHLGVCFGFSLCSSLL